MQDEQLAADGFLRVLRLKSLRFSHDTAGTLDDKRQNVINICQGR
jgi:hypothetical protein